jgi:hypothetical protein
MEGARCDFRKVDRRGNGKDLGEDDDQHEGGDGETFMRGKKIFWARTVKGSAATV